MARAATAKTTARRTAAKAAGSTRRTASRTASPAKKSTSARSSSPQRQAKQTAEQAQQQAMGTVKEQLGQRSAQAAEQLRGTAHDVRELADQLRAQDNDAAARVAALVAEKVDGAGQYLGRSTPDELLDDLEDLARQRPWLAAFGAAAVGFAGARLLTSSRRRRHGGAFIDADAAIDDAAELPGARR